jgi:histidinol dehydrogenase
MIPIYDNIPQAQATILRRAAWDEQRIPAAVLDGIERIFGQRLTPEQAVATVLADVRKRGDAAVLEWSQRIDGSALEALAVPQAEIDAAVAGLDPTLLDALKLAAQRLEAFHRKQPTSSWMDVTPGGMLGQIVRPLQRVGVYAPAGTAPLPSSLLHAAIPARVAGVQQIIVCTPPSHPVSQSPNHFPHASPRVAPLTLAAAKVAGVDAVYAIGGAQAIAAMAYGTESVPRVDKIVGPGGLFVTLAKRQVFGVVGIDGLPGPTETLVIADDTADPAIAAADLLAQAEHDLLASAILLTPSRRLAERVQVEVARQLETLSRAEIAAASLAGRGGIVVTADLAQAVDLANTYAPEHLCLLTAEPWALVGRIENAGGIFVGEHSFEVLGDYVAGPSHVMPTEGTARFASPLSVADFVKRISLIALGADEGRRLSAPAALLADGEGLMAHAAAARARIVNSEQ